MAICGYEFPELPLCGQHLGHDGEHIPWGSGANHRERDDFECHITVPQSHSTVALAVAEDYDWKTSEILGDPLLGDKAHFYLTCHGTDYTEVWTKMHSTVGVLLEREVPVLREKIEQIVHDVRYEQEAV